MDASTTESSNGVLQSLPPELPYNLRDRKKWICIIWTIVCLNSCLFPIILFYALWYGTDLKHWVIFAITTCLVGILDVAPTLTLRAIKLIRTNDFSRPLGGRRWGMDFFMFNFTLGFILVAIELIAGTAPHEPLLRLLAMPAPTILFYHGAQLTLFTVLHVANIRTPFRVSSVPRGERMPPGLYTLIEDVVSVDGNGGKPYREALRDRFNASPKFRRMIINLSFFWSIPALVVAGAVTAVIFTVDRPVGYGIGWVVPFIWAGLWAFTTIKWVQHSLREEKEAWVAALPKL